MMCEQCNLMMSNAVSLTLGMLTKNNFLSEADALTTRLVTVRVHLCLIEEWENIFHFYASCFI